MATQKRALGRHADAFLIGFESAFGTPPADGYINTAFYTHGLQETRTKIEDPALGLANFNDRDTARITEGLPNLAGDLTSPLCLNGIGDLLRLLFGAPTSTGSGPYTHVFTSGADILPTATLQLPRRRDGATTKFQGFSGIAANNFRVDQSKTDGEQRVSMGLIGRNEIAPTETTLDASPTVRVYKPLAATLAKVSLGGVVGRATGVSLNYANNLQAVNALDGTEYMTGMEAGPGALSATFTARYENEEILDIARARTESALELSWTLLNGVSAGVNGSLTLAAPVVEIARRGAPVDGPGGIDLSFEIIARQSASAHMLTATLINGLAGSEYGAA